MAAGLVLKHTHKDLYWADYTKIDNSEYGPIWVTLDKALRTLEHERSLGQIQKVRGVVGTWVYPPIEPIEMTPAFSLEEIESAKDMIGESE